MPTIDKKPFLPFGDPLALIATLSPAFIFKNSFSAF